MDYDLKMLNNHVLHVKNTYYLFCMYCMLNMMSPSTKRRVNCPLPFVVENEAEIAVVLLVCSY